MDSGKTHSLGQRAFFLFLFTRIKMPLFLFALTGVIWYYRASVPEEYLPWMEFAWEVAGMIALAYFALMLIWTYLEYKRYTYRFEEEAFIVTKGYIVLNEFGVVYHQIQGVNIRRTPLDRMLGVSQIVILMNGTNDDPERSQIILPALGGRKAKLVQNELLARARRHSVGS